MAIDIMHRIQDITWRYASIVKDAGGLQIALQEIEKVQDAIRRGLVANNAIEVENLAMTAEAVVRASLQRTETRGTHHRPDFPHRDDALRRPHASVKLVGGAMIAGFVPCRD